MKQPDWFETNFLERLYFTNRDRILDQHRRDPERKFYKALWRLDDGSYKYGPLRKLDADRMMMWRTYTPIRRAGIPRKREGFPVRKGI